MELAFVCVAKAETSCSPMQASNLYHTEKNNRHIKKAPEAKKFELFIQFYFR